MEKIAIVSRSKNNVVVRSKRMLLLDGEDCYCFSIEKVVVVCRTRRL